MTFNQQPHRRRAETLIDACIMAFGYGPKGVSPLVAAARRHNFSPALFRSHGIGVQGVGSCRPPRTTRGDGLKCLRGP